MKPMIVTVAARPRMRSSDGGRAHGDTREAEPRAQVPTWPKSDTTLPGSTKVAEPKEPPRRRLARQVLRMATLMDEEDKGHKTTSGHRIY